MRIGHGVLEVVRACIDEGIKKFCVGALEEGIFLRENGIIDEEILLLLPPAFESIKEIIKYRITITVYKLEHLELIKKEEKNIPIEIEIDTGIGRSGCKENEYVKMLDYIKRNNMNLKGIYTHLYDKNNYTNSYKQLQELKKYKCDINGVKYHIGGGYALCHGKEFLLDELRIGNGIYGLADMSLGNITLKPVLELNSKICDIINVKKGERLGYSDKGIVFENDVKLAILNLGYSYGYPYLQESFVKVKDKFCKIVGGVNMMNLCVDITSVNNIKVGDWINVYSINNEDKNAIINLSKYTNLKPGLFVCELNEKYFSKRIVESVHEN